MIRTVRELHWIAKVSLAVLIVFLVLVICSVVQVNLFVLVTPVVAAFLVVTGFLVLLVVCGLRWIRVQERVATETIAELRGIHTEIRALAPSIESMQEKPGKPKPAPGTADDEPPG